MSIGQARAGRDIRIVQKVGLGALGVAMIVAAAIGMTGFFRSQDVTIDTGVVLAMAEAQGFVSPDEAALLTERVERTEADLTQLREVHPDWKAEIDAAITAFNQSDLGAAREAFARIDALIGARRAELRLEEARSKSAQATLFYPYEYSKSAPLLCEAAELAETEVWYWIGCGRARVALGDLTSAVAAFEAARDLSRHAESERDYSVALNEIGNVRVAQGRLDDALDAYTEDLGFARDLAARDPGNDEWARDVSVSLEKVGDVSVAQGRLDDALDAFTESLGIARDLAGRDPGNAGWARDVSVSLNKVGDVCVAQGRLDDALDAFTESLGIARDLAGRDPGNAGWARDVSVSLNKVGEVRVAQGRLGDALDAFTESLGIRRDLHGRDPANAGWARDVSVSLNKVGDVSIAEGRLDHALDAYTEGLGIRRDLHGRDPANAGWVRDVSVSLNKVGDVRFAQGQLGDALDTYTESLGMRRDLAGRDPGNAEWARDVVVSVWKLAEADTVNSATHWEEVVERLEAMEARGILWPVDVPYLKTARENLAAARE